MIPHYPFGAGRLCDVGWRLVRCTQRVGDPHAADRLGAADLESHSSTDTLCRVPSMGLDMGHLEPTDDGDASGFETGVRPLRAALTDDAGDGLPTKCS